jgi:D-glycero-D-manno-heptose 1,7-bisphosphate phosphatase
VKPTRAVFLDRDGVLVDDVGPLVSTDEVRLLPGVAEALEILHAAGFTLVVVSNQTAIARGLASEDDVIEVQREIEARLAAAGAPAIADFLFCPHHPNATRPSYRVACECRKPQPGLIHAACERHGLDAAASVMIGDRPSDIVAGRSAGCRTVWVQTGRHLDPMIEATEPYALPVADHVCSDLLAAARWLVAQEEVAA